MENRGVEKRNEPSTLQGTISRITYQHPDTHYTVARIEIDGASSCDGRGCDLSGF